MRITLLITMAWLFAGCGRAIPYDAPDRAPAMPSSCAFVRVEGGAKINPSQQLYVYSCAADQVGAVLEYVDKFGLIENICLDSPAHAC